MKFKHVCQCAPTEGHRLWAVPESCDFDWSKYVEGHTVLVEVDPSTKVLFRDNWSGFGDWDSGWIEVTAAEAEILCQKAVRSVYRFCGESFPCEPEVVIPAGFWNLTTN